MKTILATIILYFSCLAISNGQHPAQDVLYLNDGSIIRGSILKMEPTGQVSIVTIGGNVFSYRMEQVKEIQREPIAVPQQQGYHRRGYVNLTDVGLLVGSDHYNNKASLSMHLINAYQFENRLSAGFGVGIEFFDVAMMPLFADGRFYLGDQIGSPFIFLQSGFCLALSSHYNAKDNAGFMVNPGIGIKKYLAQKTAFLFSIGYRYQRQQVAYTDENPYYYNYYPQSSVQQLNIYNRISVRMGFSF